jgi:hypothetical protein
MVLGIDFPGIWCKTKEGTNNEEIAIPKRLEKVVIPLQIWSFVLIRFRMMRSRACRGLGSSIWTIDMRLESCPLNEKRRWKTKMRPRGS